MRFGLLSGPRNIGHSRRHSGPGRDSLPSPPAAAKVVAPGIAESFGGLGFLKVPF